MYNPRPGLKQCKFIFFGTFLDFWNTSMPNTVEIRKMIPIVQPSPKRERRRKVLTSSESEDND